MKEKWRQVVGYEGLYEVSDQGRLRRNGRILAMNPSPNGYVKTTLCKNGERRDVNTHVLVLEAFVGPRPTGMETLHADDVRRNNKLGNLSWGTRKKNAEDRVAKGRQVSGMAHPHCKLTPEAVAEIRSSKPGTRGLADKYGVNRSLVRRVRIGQAQVHT